MGWIKKLLKRKETREIMEELSEPVEERIREITTVERFTSNAGLGVVEFIAACKGAGLDPYERCKEILESSGIDWVAKWYVVVMLGELQYDIAQLSRMLCMMDQAILGKRLPTHDVTYATCAQRSIEEMGDELSQIQGLLEMALMKAKHRKTQTNLDLTSRLEDPLGRSE
jgi:hypothetical protein